MARDHALTAPLDPERSILRPIACVRYTELDGAGVLCHTDDRALHRLSPAASAVWGVLDGCRSISEIHRALGAGPAGPSLIQTVELLRRLRALELVGDRVDVDAADDPSPSDVLNASVAHPDTLTLHGVLIAASEEATGAGMRTLHLADLTTADRETDDALPVHLDGAGIIVGDAPIDRITATSADPGTQPVPAFAALEHLVRSADRGDLVDRNGLDALADIAELVPLFEVHD